MIRDFIALKTFSTIAALGSFARAADKLGISRAMASKHIADLEAELGVKLINRTTRQLSLTEAGQTLNATAITIFGLLETTEQDIRAASTSPARHAAYQRPNVLRRPSPRAHRQRVSRAMP